jgi:carboxyl-terminal processing protease
MPRRNLWLSASLAAVCVVCALKVNRYGRVFAFAMDEVRRRFVRDVDEQPLFEGALSGMLQQLKDEPSTYLPPEDYSGIDEDLRQEFGGVGIEFVLDPDTRQITVAMTIPGAPAEEAGVRPLDRILKVNGKSIKGLALDRVRDLVKGPVGKAVVLTIQHDGEKDPVDLPIVRAKIQTDSVVGDRRKPDRTWDLSLEGDPRIGYVRITSFGQRTADEVDKAMRGLLVGGMQGLILDLRDNHGGLLIPAVDVCDLFIASGEIVTTRGRDNKVRQHYQARGQRTLPGFPVAVLVNGYSASASELLAACLQDHHRAVIVGERSYGKGTVQEIVELPPGFGALKVTVADYWRPSGKNINRPPKTGESGNGAAKPEPDGDWGVIPDKGYDVPMDAKQMERLNRWRLQQHLRGPKAGHQPQGGRGNRKAESSSPATRQPETKPEPIQRIEVDPQLAKAVEYVRREISPRR